MTDCVDFPHFLFPSWVKNTTLPHWETRCCCGGTIPAAAAVLVEAHVLVVLYYYIITGKPSACCPLCLTVAGHYCTFNKHRAGITSFRSSSLSSPEFPAVPVVLWNLKFWNGTVLTVFFNDTSGF